MLEMPGIIIKPSSLKPKALIEKFENSLRKHALLQSVLFVGLFFSAVNILYVVMVVAVFQSWLLTYWLDRRFPFCLIPTWFFLLVSIALFLIGAYYYPKNRPKLHFDKVNRLLICVTVGIFSWIVVALGLTHTLKDLGDFNMLYILRNAFSGTDLTALPWAAVDVFPTMGDTIFIGYVLAFFLLFLATWRAFRTVRQDGRILVLGRQNMHWQ